MGSGFSVGPCCGGDGTAPGGRCAGTADGDRGEGAPSARGDGVTGVVGAAAAVLIVGAGRSGGGARRSAVAGAASLASGSASAAGGSGASSGVGGETVALAGSRATGCCGTGAGTAVVSPAGGFTPGVAPLRACRASRRSCCAKRIRSTKAFDPPPGAASALRVAEADGAPAVAGTGVPAASRDGFCAVATGRSVRGTSGVVCASCDGLWVAIQPAASNTTAPAAITGLLRHGALDVREWRACSLANFSRHGGAPAASAGRSSSFFKARRMELTASLPAGSRCGAC